MEDFFIQMTNAAATVFEFTFALGMVMFSFLIVTLMFGRG